MKKIRHILDISRLNPYQQLGLRRFNFRLIARLTGMLLVYMAASMVLPLAVSLYYRDGAQFALVLTAIIILTTIIILIAITIIIIEIHACGECIFFAFFGFSTESEV